MAEFTTRALALELEAYGAEVKRDVDTLFGGAAETLRSRLHAAYPRGRTGNLQDRISLKTLGGEGVRTRLVRATSPHVHIYQTGTKARHDATRGNAYRGVSPPHGRIFERLAAASRLAALQAAQALLDQQREA